MDNATIAEHFSLLSQLMDINGENSFKSRTYSIAAYHIERIPVPVKEMSADDLFATKGIGNSIGQKIVELLETAKLSLLDQYIANTPPGVVEMLNIKGIGPKKIHTIWKEMGIESLGELLYACNENRLTLYKGFGAKTQQNVQEAIEFYMQNQGSFLYAQLEEIFPQIDPYLKKMFGEKNTAVTGAYKRQAITLDELEYVVLHPAEKIKAAFQTAQPPELLEETDDSISYKLKNGLKMKLYIRRDDLALRVFETSCSPAFLEKFKERYPSFSVLKNMDSDELIFNEFKLPVIPFCLRETPEIIDTAKSNKLPVLIQPEDIKGIIHSHSNWSDGSSTIEEMAKECIRRGLEYLVISDHSKTASYANGLSEERLKEQHKYVDELNKKLAPFKIFKSIESDILGDGSLDYPDEVLASFDLVIASVHSNLKMNEEKAMSRLLKAIENPFTTILGHPTGRLLLSRNGYPVNHQKIIDACAANNVAIELNAHPRRLDLDWQHIGYALEKGVLISVNPDAHYLHGFDDTRYGVLAAQKSGLTKERNLSSFSLPEFEKYVTERKNKIVH